MSETLQEINKGNEMSAIDKALAAAQARKAMKEGLSMETGMINKVDDSAKRAAKAARDAERAARQAQLKAQRDERKAAKATKSDGKPVHMKKVERAASKLPMLNDQMQLTFNEVTTNFSAEQITALALHLQHFNRVKATERALNQRAELGQKVRIIGGDPKFIGMTGTVSLARRIRCFVDVPGFKKPVYCFTSDVELVEETSQATGTDG